MSRGIRFASRRRFRGNRSFSSSGRFSAIRAAPKWRSSGGRRTGTRAGTSPSSPSPWTGGVEGRRRVRRGGDADPSAAGERREGPAAEGGEDPGGRDRQGGFLPSEKMRGRGPNPR